MRTQVENKAAAAATGYECPQCGQVDRYGCREVPMGWFCIQDGLKVDSTRLVGATPDPTAQKVADDPRVKAARVAVAEARAAYDEADETWTAAALTKSTLEVTANSTARTLFSMTMDPIPDPAVERQLRQAHEMRDTVEQAYEHRERAAKALQKAQQLERLAIARVRREIGYV